MLAAEHAQEQERTRPPEDFVAEEREGHPTVRGRQQRPEHADALEPARPDPHPAAELGRGSSAASPRGHRFGVVDDPAPDRRFASSGMTKSSMSVPGRTSGNSVLADGVDRAVRPRAAPEPALALLQERLVLPVEAVDVPAGPRVGQDEPAAHHAHVRVGEPGRQPPGGVRGHERVRVRQDHHLAAQSGDGRRSGRSPCRGSPRTRTA